MKGNQTRNGKAFEYACLYTIQTMLSNVTQVQIEGNPQFETAQAHFNSLPGVAQNAMIQAANAAVQVVVRLEPRLIYANQNQPLFLSLQGDAEGRHGDVRDVLCIRRQNGWEIGLSCKHNHHAVKHSRLSATIDFGQEWFGIPCSCEYFDSITPLFDELREIRDSSGRTTRWSGIRDKIQRFYVPILRAFMEELRCLDERNPQIIPERLIKYLIGQHDFYKVITDEKRKTTRVEAINLYGTLNRPSEGNHAETNVPRLRLPTKFYHVGFKNNSNTTIEVVCDEGWTISMRIHSAETLVTPSLKFDVRLISLPHTIHAQVVPW